MWWWRPKQHWVHFPNKWENPRMLRCERNKHHYIYIKNCTRCLTLCNTNKHFSFSSIYCVSVSIIISYLIKLVLHPFFWLSCTIFGAFNHTWPSSALFISANSSSLRVWDLNCSVRRFIDVLTHQLFVWFIWITIHLVIFQSVKHCSKVNRQKNQEVGWEIDI